MADKLPTVHVVPGYEWGETYIVLGNRFVTSAPGGLYISLGRTQWHRSVEERCCGGKQRRGGWMA